MEHQMLSWLRCDLNTKGTHMVSLYFAVCRKYKANILSLKNFRRDWLIGATNKRTSNLIDQATSDIHRASKWSNRERGGQSVPTLTTIGRFLSLMDNKMQERMAKKFVFLDGEGKLTFHEISHLVGTRISPRS